MEKGWRMILPLQIIVIGSQTANVLASTGNLNVMNTIYVLHYYMDFIPFTSPTMCYDPFVVVVKNGLIAIIAILRTLAVTATVHGIVMGGLTRMLSFGNARRIAQSNREIIEAIVGLIIVILSVAVGNQIPVWFGLADHTCLIGP
jgi:hypothetical protein